MKEHLLLTNETVTLRIEVDTNGVKINDVDIVLSDVNNALYVITADALNLYILIGIAPQSK